MADDEELIGALKKAETLALSVSELFRPTAFAKAFDVLVDRGTIKEHPAKPGTGVRATSAVPKSFIELHAVKAPRNHVSRVVLLAYHRLHTSPQEPRIGTTEIVEAYKGVRERKPQNIPDVIKQATRRGLLVPAEARDGKKMWVINSLGEKYVENGFKR